VPFLQGTHNNYIERQIEHYATGRRAWLFSCDAVGAQASANLYSLVMTCRANAVEPYAYLNYPFEHLPAATTVEQFEALLPWNVKAVLAEPNSTPWSCTGTPHPQAQTICPGSPATTSC
jgi:hypothetical protein